MKIVRLIVGLFVLLYTFAPSAVAANIALKQVSSSAVTATLEPDWFDMGAPVNIWVAAVYGPNTFFLDEKGWGTYRGGEFPVAVRSATLQPSNTVSVVSGFDVSALPGIEIYLGYGYNEVDMVGSPGKLARIYPGDPTSFTLTGTAALSGAFSNAAIGVLDSKGQFFSGGLTESNGSFSVAIPKTASPPFVLTAVRDDKTLVSAIAEAKDGNVNITPITNLIASRLATSGNPSTLANELIANPGLFNASKLAEKLTEVSALIRPVTDAAGDVTNPLTGKFSVDGSGHSKVIDSLSIDITPSSATSVNIEVTTRQRLTDGASPTAVAFTNTTAPLSSLSQVSTADIAPSGTAALIAEFLKRFTDCFALPASDRVTAGVTTATSIKAVVCKALFVGDDATSFKHDGAVVSSTGAFAPLFNGGVTGVTFDRGSYEFAQANGDIVIGYRTVTSLGSIQNNNTLVVRLQGTPAQLKAVGNQYKYSGGINAYHQLREYVNQPSASYFSTGYNININNSVDSVGRPLFKRVEVTSPRREVFTLVPTVGSSILSLTRNNVVYSGSSFVRYRSASADPLQIGDLTKTLDASVLYFVDPPVSDLELASFAAQSTWKFDYFLASNLGSTPDETQYYQTRARAMTVAELATRGFASLTDSDISNWRSNTRISTTGFKYLPTPATGPFAMNWVVPENTLTPTSIKVWGGIVTANGNVFFDDSATVISTSRSGNVSCSKQTMLDAHCIAGGSYAAGFLSAAHLFANEATGRQFAHLYSTISDDIPSAPVNGIAVPAEPAATQKNATLAGVDTNRNGVRDEVDRALAQSYGTNSTNYTSAVTFATQLQKFLVLGSVDQSKALQALSEELSAYQCLKAKVGEENARMIVQEVSLRTFNTRVRMDERQRIYDSLGVFVLPELGGATC